MNNKRILLSVLFALALIVMPIPAVAQVVTSDQSITREEFEHFRAVVEAFHLLEDAANAGGGIGCNSGTKAERCECYTDRATFYCAAQDANSRRLCDYYTRKVEQLCN